MEDVGGTVLESVGKWDTEENLSLLKDRGEEEWEKQWEDGNEGYDGVNSDDGMNNGSIRKHESHSLIQNSKVRSRLLKKTYEHRGNP